MRVTSLRIGGGRASSGDWLLLGGVVLAAVAVVVWLVVVLRPGDASGARSLGDFHAFARIIDAPGQRDLVSVAAIEAVVPFPILLPSEIEVDSIMAVVYLQPRWRPSLRLRTRPTCLSGSCLTEGMCSFISTEGRSACGTCFGQGT